MSLEITAAAKKAQQEAVQLIDEMFSMIKKLESEKASLILQNAVLKSQVSNLEAKLNDIE